MNNSFFSRFTPKEPKFFPLLKQMSEVIIKASDILIESLHSKSHQDFLEYYKKIKEQEREGDKLSHKIYDELNSTFITPFDREDINHLANMLDDVTDGINSCAKRIALYNPKKIPASAIEQANIIKESAVLIDKAIEEIDNLKKNRNSIKQYCRSLHDLENQGDDVYEKFIIRLFEEEEDAIEIMKVKEIVHELEKTLDASEQVGKIIRTIIIKYA